MIRLKSHHFIDKATKKRRGKRKTPEYDFHCEVADTLDKILNPNLTCWSSVENSNHTGGISGMIKQGKDKRKGVKSGFPDIVILYNGTCLCIELKATKGVISDSQDLFHKKIISSGNRIEVVRSLTDLVMVLCVHQVPTLVREYI